MSLPIQDLLVLIGTILSAFIASYYGYKQISKKSELDLQSSLLKNVNDQNAELRQYLSDELKDTIEKHRSITDELEQKIRRQQEELEYLKREKEKLELRLFRIKLTLVKYGLDCMGEDEDSDRYIEESIRKLAEMVNKEKNNGTD